MAAYHDIQIHATHLPGVENTTADSLSLNNIPIFLQAVPDAGDPTNAHPPSSGGHGGKGESRLVITSLGPTIQRLLKAGLAPSMQRAYMAGKKYLMFCQEAGTAPLYQQLSKSS